MMSDVNEAHDNQSMTHCANCGTTQGDAVQLKMCNGCKSVKYCGLTCQKEHRPQHKGACKKRAAELRDKILFTQPEGRHLGDCPICCLPLSINLKDCIVMECCSKFICNGCQHVNKMQSVEKTFSSKKLTMPLCAFCRSPEPLSDEEMERNHMKRVEAGDAFAIWRAGVHSYQKGDYQRAFDYNTKAAKMGNFNAQYNLAGMYMMGVGVKADEKKMYHHLEEAAIGGNAEARNALGAEELQRFRGERAVKHFVIAAKQGNESSLNTLKELYANGGGLVSRDDLSVALSGYQAALDEMKSPQREAAEAFCARMNVS